VDQDLIPEIDFKKYRLALADEIEVGGTPYSCEHILTKLAPMMKDERLLRLKTVVAERSFHVMPLLENIYDRGNVSAVMRSTEAFGFIRVGLVDRPEAKFKAANRVTKGAEKWLDVRSYPSAAESVRQLKGLGYQIWATDLNTEHSISDIDWSKPTAIVLGNEKEGTSPEMLGLVDGRFRIPMVGFSQSFNISVAGALIFYHAHEQIKKLGARAKLNEQEQKQVLANYYLRCFDNPEKLL
jgi:tRNA (guanosine-2'-O-)-methyltransferase